MKNSEKPQAPRDVMLFPHQTPTGLRCEGGWAEAQPVAPNKVLPYRCRACGALATRDNPAIRGH